MRDIGLLGSPSFLTFPAVPTKFTTLSTLFLVGKIHILEVAGSIPTSTKFAIMANFPYMLAKLVNLTLDLQKKVQKTIKKSIPPSKE